MDDEIERLVIGVRADTAGFAREIETMRATLGGSLEGGADRAGRAIEQALGRAIRSGKLGFDDLKRTALSVLGEIAAAAVSGGIRSVLGGGRATGGGLAAVATSLIGAVSGLPGRATGGPVAPGTAYLVGERGPELFVPTASGQVRTMAQMTRPEPREAHTREIVSATPVPVSEARTPPLVPAPPAAREVRVAIAIHAPAGSAAEALTRSSRQVARAVRGALTAAER